MEGQPLHCASVRVCVRVCVCACVCVCVCACVCVCVSGNRYRSMASSECDDLLFCCCLLSELHPAQPLAEPVLHEGSPGKGRPGVRQGRLLVHAPRLRGEAHVPGLRQTQEEGNPSLPVRRTHHKVSSGSVRCTCTLYMAFDMHNYVPDN